MGKSLASRGRRPVAKVAKLAKAKPAGRRAREGSSGAIRSYKSALNYLSTKTNYERMLRVSYSHANFNLARMHRLLDGLGNPHRKFKSLHVAGTKGKGSTCHMLAGMLQRLGLKVGLYTSPHLIDMRERIRIDAELVSEAEFTRLVARTAPVVHRLRAENPTFFEILTAMAFLHFANAKVDYAVIETGLGGRLDSTNVIKPEVCGLVNISLDHMQQLGHRVEAIAEEKAGIFKPGVPVISAPQTPGVKRVLREHAQRVGCELRFVGDELDFSYRFEVSRLAGPHARVCMLTPTSRFDHVQVPLLGEHQATNCAVALGMLDALRRKGVAIHEQTAVDGLANIHVPGRLEIIRENPRTVVDCAHNAASIGALMRAIGQNITYDSMVVIFACAADKDIDGMLEQLQLGADKVIFTSNGTPRSAEPKELLTRFGEKSQKMAQMEATLRAAYQTALHCVTRDDLICITGSMYLVGLAKQELAGAVAV